MHAAVCRTDCSQASHKDSCKTMVDAMEINPFAFAIGIVYLAAAFPLSYGLFVTSAFLYQAPLRGAGDMLSRGLLVLSFISFPVLIIVGGCKMLYVTGNDWSDFSPMMLPMYSALLLVANKFTGQ